MAARVSVALRLKSEAADRLGLQRASWTRSFGLYRDLAWHGRPRVDRRSVGVRFDTEPEEEEGDADMRARFVSETEREGRRAAAAGTHGLLGFDFGPRRRRKEVCCVCWIGLVQDEGCGAAGLSRTKGERTGLSTKNSD